MDTEAKRLNRLVATSSTSLASRSARRSRNSSSGRSRRSSGGRWPSSGRTQRVSVTLPANLEPIEVDGAQIEHVLVNLIDNALTFSPEIPSSSNAAERRAHRSRRRSGPGLTDEQLGRIFEPFEYGARPSGAQDSGSRSHEVLLR